MILKYYAQSIAIAVVINTGWTVYNEHTHKPEDDIDFNINPAIISLFSTLLY